MLAVHRLCRLGNAALQQVMPLAAKLHRSATSSPLQLSHRLLLRTFAACDLPQARRHLFCTLAHHEQPEARHFEPSETQPLERALPAKLVYEAVENTQDGRAADPQQGSSAEPKLTHVDRCPLQGISLNAAAP